MARENNNVAKSRTKKSNTKASKNKKKSVPEENGDIKGIIYISVGILLAVAIYTTLAGALSVFSRTFIYKLIGIATYILPAYLIYFGVDSILAKGSIRFSRRFFGVTLATLMIMFFCGAVRLNGIEDNLGTGSTIGFSEGLKMLTLEGGIESGIHGGALGYLISYPISRLIGYAGSYILYFTISFIGLVLIFDITLYDVVVYLREFMAKNKKVKIGNKESKGKNRYNVDLDMESNEIVNEPSFIEVKDKSEDTERKDFIHGINNKIKILDFMKNTSFDDEVAIEKEKKAKSKVLNNNPFNIEVYDEEVNTEEVNKESQLELEEKTKPSSDTKESLTLSSIEKSPSNRENLESDVKEGVTKEIESIISQSKEKKVEKEYLYPSVDLLNINSKMKLKSEDKKELIENANKLEAILNDFGVDGKVVQVTKGPSVTRFELQPSPGVKVSKFVNLQDDIALGLAASGVRMEAPIPGKSAIGIEVPNKKQTPVFLREVLDSKEFTNSSNTLAFALGKDIAGKCVVGDLSKMPHMLIAGATGSGKSVCINTLIVSILYKYNPNEVKLLMIDPKVVELSVYNGVPHLLIPVVTDPKKAAAALNWAVVEMDKRYNQFATHGARNIESYNKLYEKGIIEEKLPYVVMIVDELADLMMACPNDVEDYICRLAQKARAAGMHLIIATQRPSVDVITGVIKANIPSRISFSVSSMVDSRTILDQGGAEKLLGRGDMLYSPIGEGKPLRVQGAFISEEEVEKVVSYVKEKEVSETSYQEEILQHINSEVQESETTMGNKEVDELLDKAIEIVVEYQQASTSFIQRKLRIGFNRAARIMDELEEQGVISTKDGSKPRQVLVSKSTISEE